MSTLKLGILSKLIQTKKCITYKLYNKWEVWKVDGKKVFSDPFGVKSQVSSLGVQYLKVSNGKCKYFLTD